MTSPIDPYYDSRLLALKTIGLQGMNPTYRSSQKDIDSLKIPFDQALSALMTPSDNIEFPEYNTFKTTILSLTDKIYGKNSIGPLFKTLLDAMNVNSDGNLVLSTTNSKQLQKIDKLVADFEYQFESTYGVALFKTLGLDLSQKTNMAMESTVSKFSKAELGYKPKGVPKGVSIASPAAGGAQVGGGLYEDFIQIKDKTLDYTNLGVFKTIRLFVLEEALKRHSKSKDFDPIAVATFLVDLAYVRATHQDDRDAEAYLTEVQLRIRNGTPDWPNRIIGVATGGIVLYGGYGVLTAQLAAMRMVNPPALFNGLRGLDFMNKLSTILSRARYHTIGSTISQALTGSAGGEIMAGIITIIAAVVFAFLLYIGLLLYKKLVRTHRLSYDEATREFNDAVAEIKDVVLKGVQATTRFGVITAAAAASMALGLPAPVAISAAASALGSNGSAANGVVSLMQQSTIEASRRAAQRRALLNGHASPAAAASSSSSVAPRQYQPGSSSPSIRSLLSDHALGMAAASLAPSAAANLSSRSGASASSSSSGSGDDLPPAERANYEAQRQKFQGLEAQRRELEAQRRAFEESKAKPGPGPGGARRKRTIRNIKHKKRHTKRHTRK